MQTRIFDLDDSLVRQHQLLRQSRAGILPLREWGPVLRMACSHGSFRRFEDRLTTLLGGESERQSCLNFLGSGDFHHVSLALLRRLRRRCNLLVLDNHPDWMRRPLLALRNLAAPRRPAAEDRKDISRRRRSRFRQRLLLARAVVDAAE